MKRKIIQIAGSTKLVSIPSEWAKKFDFKKGDTVNVEEQNNRIIITSDKARKVSKAEVDARDLEERTLRWKLASLHRSGYGEITILYKESKTLKIVEDLVKNLMLGFVVSEQTDKKIVLKCMASEVEGEFDNALRRSFLVTQGLGESVIDYLRLNKKDNLISLEKSNNQLTNFCERLLNFGIYDYPKTTFLYTIIWNLEKIADEFKYILQLENVKSSGEILSLFEDVNKLFRDYHSVFYNFNIRRFNDLYIRAKRIETKIVKVKGDFKLKFHLMNIVSKLLDFSSCFIGLKGNDNN